MPKKYKVTQNTHRIYEFIPQLGARTQCIIMSATQLFQCSLQPSNYTFSKGIKEIRYMKRCMHLFNVAYYDAASSSIEN